MKSYVPWKGLEPVVLSLKWISPVDKLEADLIKDDIDEFKTMMVHVMRGRMDLPWLNKPWLLGKEAVNEYWHKVYEHWME